MAEIKTIIRADSTQHDSTVKKSANEIYKYQKKVDTAKKSLSTMVSTVGKFAGALGIAVSAGALFAKNLKEIETVSDAVERGQKRMNEAVKAMFTQINAGSFDNFIRGLKDVIKNAGDAYDAIDNLGTYLNFSNADLARNQADIAEAQYMIKAIENGVIEGDKSYWEKRLKGLEEAGVEIINKQVAHYEEAIRTSDKLLFSKFGNRPELLQQLKDKYTGTADKNELAQQRYNYLREQQSEINRLWGGKYGKGSNGNTIYQDWMKQFGDELEFLEIITKREKDLTEMNNLLIASENKKASAFNSKKTNLKYYDKGGSGGSGSGGKGSSSGGSSSPSYQEGSIAWYDAQIKALQDLINNQKLSAEELKNIQTQITELEQQKLEYVQGLRGGKVDLIPQLESIKPKFDEIVIGFSSVSESVEDASETIDDFFQKVNDKITAVSELGGMFLALSDAIGESDNSILGFTGKALTQLASLQTQLIAIIGEEQARAIASGAASVMDIPFPANIAALAAVIGSLASIFAGIGSFAEGGIISGATSIGDYNLARVNSGEMILNGKQQAHLFNMLNGIGSPSDNGVSGNVVFTIHGNDLVGTLNNYNKRLGRVR